MKTAMMAFEKEGKRELAYEIIEVYERTGDLLGQELFTKILHRLMRQPKARLEEFCDYIMDHEEPKKDAAFCIALGTGIFLKA